MSNLSPRSAAISIDFGTSHTVASVRRADGRVHQQLFDGSPQLPSAVFMNDEGGPLVGTDAVHNGRRKPERYEPNPKRRIDDGSILLGDQELPVTSVIAAVLSRVASECEQTLGGLGAVTITVPAAWGPTRRHVIADAATAAGLGKAALVPEPVAAASHFVETLGNDVQPGSGVVVYDLGGGTFDATVLRRSPTGFDVLAVDGADDLGGLDFDQALAEHLAASVQPDDERWQRLTAPTTQADLRHRTVFLEEVRQAKERLSRATSTDLTIPLLDIDAHLTRDELETVAQPLLERTVRITQGVIRESGLTTDQIAGLFLVGAASRMPLAATMLHRDIGIAPAAIEQPELAVSEGGLVAEALVSTPPPVPSPALPPQMTPQPSPMAPMPTPPHLTGPIATPPAGMPAPGGPVTWLKTKRGVATVGATAGALVLVLAIVVAGRLLGDSEDPGPSAGSEGTATSPTESAQSDPATDQASGPASESDGTQAGSAELPETVDLGSALLGDAVTEMAESHSGEITALEVSAVAGKPVAVTGGDDRLVRLWDLESGKLLATYRKHKEPITDVAVTLDGDRPVVISADNREEHVWYLDDVSEPADVRDGNTEFIAWIGEWDGAPAYADGRRVWQLFTGQELSDFDKPTYNEQEWGFIEVEETLRGRGISEERVFVSDLETGDFVGGTFDQHTQPIASAAFAEIGETPLAVTATADGTIQGWDLTAAEKYGTTVFERYQAVEGLALIGLDGGVAVLARGSDGLSLYNLDNGEQIGETFAAPMGDNSWTQMSVTEIDGHPVVVTSSSDGHVKVWSIKG